MIKSFLSLFTKFIILTWLISNFISCKSTSYEPIGRFSDYSLSEKELQDISYRIFITTEIDESKMPLSNEREFVIKDSEEIYAIVNWFNLSNKKYLITHEWCDADGNILKQLSGAFSPENISWFTWQSTECNRILFPEGKILLKIKLNNELIIEDEFIISYSE